MPHIIIIIMNYTEGNFMPNIIIIIISHGFSFLGEN